MKSYSYPQFLPPLSAVHIALYTDVTNSAALRARIIHAATAEGDAGDQEREAVNFAFIDARLITSYLHLETAVFQAILSASQGNLRTKTVHSEVLWTLNPSNNITEAIRRYGVSDTTTSLFVVRVTSPEITGIKSQMNAVVEGKLSPETELDGITDWQTIKRYHKLNNEQAIKNAAKDPTRERALVDNIVVSTVAMKSVVG